jgi:hypothetical protein
MPSRRLLVPGGTALSGPCHHGSQVEQGIGGPEADASVALDVPEPEQRTPTRHAHFAGKTR